MRVVLGLSVVLATLPARAQSLDRVEDAAAPSSAESHPGLFADAARLPASGTLRTRATLDTTISGGSLLASWSATSGFALFAGARTATRRVGPEAGVHLQLASQEAHGVDVVATGSVHSPPMMEGAGSEVEGRLAIGRSAGRWRVTANGAVGQGFGERRDVDFEGALQLSVHVAEPLLLGAESRVRLELADRDIPNVGRAYDMIAGPSAYLSVGAARIDGLLGWNVPRGLARPGPAAMLGTSVTF
jgi:hypothetical protein